ncbi:MAG: monovalent cation/H+ antiporter complex subunit F [Opitutales bacterium]
MDDFLSFCILTAYVLLSLAMILTVVRLFRGPDLTDRVTALDALAGITLSFALVLAIESGEEAFMDVSIAVAVVGFMGTVALARLIERRHSGK